MAIEFTTERGATELREEVLCLLADSRSSLKSCRLRQEWWHAVAVVRVEIFLPVAKLKRDEYTDRKRLRCAGWDIQKRDATAFNSGSETVTHYLTKAAVAWVLKQEGYRVDTEVAKDGASEIDVVAYGAESPPFAVEVETDPSEDVVRDKLSRYHDGEPYREVFILDLGDAPQEIDALVAWVRGEIVG